MEFFVYVFRSPRSLSHSLGTFPPSSSLSEHTKSIHFCPSAERFFWNRCLRTWYTRTHIPENSIDFSLLLGIGIAFAGIHYNEYGGIGLIPKQNHFENTRKQEKHPILMTTSNQIESKSNRSIHFKSSARDCFWWVSVCVWYTFPFVSTAQSASSGNLRLVWAARTKTEFIVVFSCVYSIFIRFAVTVYWFDICCHSEIHTRRFVVLQSTKEIFMCFFFLSLSLGIFVYVIAFASVKYLERRCLLFVLFSFVRQSWGDTSVISLS